MRVLTLNQFCSLSKSNRIKYVKKVVSTLDLTQWNLEYLDGKSLKFYNLLLQVPFNIDNVKLYFKNPLIERFSGDNCYKITFDADIPEGLVIEVEFSHSGSIKIVNTRIYGSYMYEAKVNSSDDSSVLSAPTPRTVGEFINLVNAVGASLQFKGNKRELPYKNYHEFIRVSRPKELASSKLIDYLLVEADSPEEAQKKLQGHPDLLSSVWSLTGDVSFRSISDFSRLINHYRCKSEFNEVEIACLVISDSGIQTIENESFNFL